MMVQVETFAKNSDAPAQISPELVLVAPPEEARAAREALAEPQAPERAQPPKQAPAAVAAPRAEVLRRAVPTATPAVGVPRAEAPPARVAPPPPPPALPAPAPAAPVRRRRVLLLGFALVLAVGGFVAGRQLGERNGGSNAATRPGTAQSVSQPRGTSTQPQSAGTTAARSTSSSAAATTAPPAPPAPVAPSVSWKPHAGVRHYRLDLVRGGAVVLTILTDEPRADIPLTYPNAGRESRLAPGTYVWRVRAGTARPSRVLAHGTVRVH